MNRFDIHVNLGSFPSSGKGKKDNSQRYISPQEMNEYFISHNITHALVLYNRDEYDLLKELGDITQTKIYGVQCVMGREDSPTNIKEPFKLDLGKPYVYGIKMASHRGWWTDGKEKWAGLDYMSPWIQKLLKTLPKNTLVSVHTQGTSSLDNVARPMFIANMAYKYPYLKWIMNHGGEYGPAMLVARPSSKRLNVLEGRRDLHRHITHRMSVVSAIEAAEAYHNIFIDSSCWTVSKGYHYKDCSQWCVGSDFPFSENFGVNYTEQRNLFEKSLEIPDDNAVHFFETDVAKLYEEWIPKTDIQVQQFFLSAAKKRKDQKRIDKIENFLKDFL